MNAAVLTLLGALAASPAPAPPADFAAMLARVDAAQLELQNGRGAAFNDLWSRADDVTLAGGLGGVVEKGWPAVRARLEWVATQFSNGTHSNERLAWGTSGDLGYVVQHEHLRFQAPGKPEWLTRDYRVTMVFRREAGAWRLVHRHADSNLSKNPVK